MSRVAIFTDSASDMDPAEAAASGHRHRPAPRHLRHRRRSRPAWSCRPPAFWERMTAPDAPFPTTAASSPGEFKEAYEAAFAAGAEAIVSVHVAGTLSGTIKSAQIARDMLPDREIHIVDSQGASMAEGHPVPDGRRDGRRRIGPAEEIAETLDARAPGHHHLPDARHPRVPQEGRPDQRGAGGDRDAPVGQADHRGQGRRRRDGRPGADPRQGPRPDGRARDRSARSSGCRSCTRMSPDVEAFRDEVLARVPDLDPAAVSIELVGRVGRAAPRPGLHRRRGCCTGRADLGARRREGCGKVATTLPTGTIGEASEAGRRLYSGPQMSRASQLRRPIPRSDRHRHG